MTTTKIHCSLLEMPDIHWEKLSDEQIGTLLDVIQNMEMLGEPPDLHGFVGTRRLDKIIGGFFALQYEDERIYYDRQKNPTRRRDAPAERLFFVFFPNVGRILMQIRKFGDPHLNMQMAIARFREALNLAFQRVRIGFTLGFYEPQETIPDEKFIEEFTRSTRVELLAVDNPNADRIPDDFIYYNPQKERNSIIATSHRHDYPNFKKVELEATSTGDIKTTHLGKDLIQVGHPIIMRYQAEGEEFILRHQVLTKFELHVDVDAIDLSKEQLLSVIDALRRERVINIDSPIKHGPVSAQMSLFEGEAEESDE